jgi:hypothetical protein
MKFRPPGWKTIRIVGVSLALVALMIFATGVVSDWHHQGPNDDAHCPYCHLGHQTPAQFVAAPALSLLRPLSSVPLPQEAVPFSVLVFSQTAPRAPPAA